MKLLYGTTNPSKLRYMRRNLETIGIEVLGLNDLEGKLPHIAEDGQEPLDNAKQKALAYYKTFGIPVFSLDSGLYFIDEPHLEQPGTYIRRYTGNEMDDMELLNHYMNLARENGGTIKAQYINAIVLVMDEDNIFEYQGPDISWDPFYLTSKAHEKIEAGFPLNSISVEIASGKYFFDIKEKTKDASRYQEAMRSFFSKCISKE